VQWARSKGHTWGEWRCSQLAPERFVQGSSHQRNAQELFAWGHANGCPCTCEADAAAAAVAAAIAELEAAGAALEG
jgi:hypothetical protein